MIGLSPQEINLDVFFTIRELLIFQGGYYGLSIKESKKRVDKILFDLGLEEKAYSKARELSGGMKRRVQIAKALIHDPEIIILDEPTAGVSPIVMDELFDRIINVKKTGIAILMVEQNARQALAIADRGFVLVTGQNRFTDSGQVLLANEEVRRSFLGG
mgnify:CR=1 FL=1